MLRRLAEQAASVAAIRVIGTALSVAATVLIARHYGAAVLGAYAYCTLLITLAAVPVSNGWSSMLLRQVAKRGEIDAKAGAMTRTGAMLALGMAGFAAAAAFFGIAFADNDIARTLAPLVPLLLVPLALALMCDQLSAMRMASLRGLDRPAIAQAPEMLVRPLVLVVGIFLSARYLGGSDEPAPLLRVFAALALAALVSMLVGSMALRWISPAHPKAPPAPGERRQWFVSAATLAASAGLIQLNGFIDMLILGLSVTTEEIGYYRAALQIAVLANFGYVALNMLAGQRFSSLLASGDREGAARTAALLARLALLAALPMPIAVLLFGQQLFGLLFGPEFLDSVMPSLIVMIGICFSAAAGMANALLVMNHDEAIAMRATAVALVVNAGLCLLLIPLWGLVGAACANAGANILWNGLLWYFARRRTGIDSSIFSLAPTKEIGAEPVGHSASSAQELDVETAIPVRQKLYLHIGTHKTGSSSLQYWLGSQRAALKREGIAFFTGQYEPDNHVGLFALAMNEDRHSFAHEKYGIVATHEQLTRLRDRFARFRASNSNCALVASSEGLSLLRHDEEMVRLKSLLGDPLPEVTVLLVLRDKESFLQSYSNQVLKHPGRALSDDPESNTYVEPDSWLADYDAIKTIWSRHFGADALRVIDYDAAVASEGDVLPSLLRAMDVPHRFIPPPGTIQINADGIKAKLRRLLKRIRLLR